MNIVILSHERSLNKAEGLLRAHKHDIVTLVIDHKTNVALKPYVALASNLVIVKNFDIVQITKIVTKCDKIWCVSENLLPVQSQLESYYGIDNLTPYAAEVLSNKQMFDDYCRSIGLGKYVPKSVTPTFHDQLSVFQNNEIFSKPDIGTGSNVFFPGDKQNTPQIEYRRWNNRHHFLKFLSQSNIHNKFFDLNKVGMYEERFNNKPCKIMVQEYHWSNEPSIAPIGFVKDGKVNTLFYLKISKVKYGDSIDPASNPIESHSTSKASDIAKDRAVWIATADEIDNGTKNKINTFLQSLITGLKIKDLIFAGPDFHISNDRLIAIDFNPRPGQFMNILDKYDVNCVFDGIVNNVPVVIKERLLWGCAVLTPGVIRSVRHNPIVNTWLNQQNTKLENGMQIPEFQNLQNKAFNVNLDITGKSEQELFDKYKSINQLLQDSITY
jgi:hypothetical protein